LGALAKTFVRRELALVSMVGTLSFWPQSLCVESGE